MSQVSPSKAPKRKKDSTVARSYLRNLQKYATNQPPTIVTNDEFIHDSAVNIITPKAKITLNSKGTNDLSANDVQSILDDTDDMAGYKVVTEKEYKLIAYLNKREKTLIKHILRNKAAINNGKQQIDKIKREMEQKARELILKLQQKIETVTKDITERMNVTHNEIERETKFIHQLLDEVQNSKLQLKNNVNKAISSWDQLQQRSNHLIQDTKITQDIIKSVEKIEINNYINWDDIMNDFTQNIKDNLNIVVKFKSIEIEGNDISQKQIKSTQLVTQHFKNQPSQQTQEETESIHVSSIEEEVHTSSNELKDETRDPIQTQIICFTREGNVHCCNLNVNIQDPIKAEEVVWSFAPNTEDIKHRVKYPSIVRHPDTRYIYRFGGVLEGQQLNTAEFYDFTRDEWTILHDTPIARQDAISLCLNKDNIITLGGAAKVQQPSFANRRDSVIEIKEWEFYKHVSIYNINTDSWISSDDVNDGICCMNEARYAFCGLTLPNDDKVMVFGGNGHNGRSKTIELFDYDNNQWIYLQDMPIPKARHGCCWYNDNIIIAGGDSKSESKRCFIFDIVESKWIELPELNEIHDRAIVKSFPQKSCVAIFGNAGQLHNFEILDKRMSCDKWILSDIDNHPLNVDFRSGMIV